MHSIRIKLFCNKQSRPLKYEGYLECLHGYVTNLFGDNSYGTPLHTFGYSHLFCENPYHYNYGIDGIEFKDVPCFYVSTDNDTVFSNFIERFDVMREIIPGLEVEGFSIEKIDTSKMYYQTIFSSPLSLKHSLCKNTMLGKSNFDAASKYLKENLLRRASEAGISFNEDFSITIVSEKHRCACLYRGKKIRGYNVILKFDGGEDVKEFALVHGIGLKCGIGFGYII